MILGNLKEDLNIAVDSLIGYLKTGNEFLITDQALAWKKIEKYVEALKEEFIKMTPITHKNFPPDVEKRMLKWSTEVDPHALAYKILYGEAKRNPSFMKLFFVTTSE